MAIQITVLCLEEEARINTRLWSAVLRLPTEKSPVLLKGRIFLDLQNSFPVHLNDNSTQNKSWWMKHDDKHLLDGWMDGWMDGWESKLLLQGITEIIGS